MEISVIIPAYNAEAYIERCLNSLVNQTITVPYEIVIVNDGSNDNTIEISSALFSLKGHFPQLEPYYLLPATYLYILICKLV